MHHSFADDIISVSALFTKFSKLAHSIKSWTVANRVKFTNVPATSSISSVHQLQSNQQIVTQRGLTKSDSVMGIDSNGHVPTTTDIRLQRKISRLTNYLYGLAIVGVTISIIFITVIILLYAKHSHDLKYHTHRPKVSCTHGALFTVGWG